MKELIPISIKEAIFIMSSVIITWYITCAFLGMLGAAFDGIDKKSTRKLNCSKFYRYEILIPIAPVACWLKEEL